jgi:hypothetical protein
LVQAGRQSRNAKEQPWTKNDNLEEVNLVTPGEAGTGIVGAVMAMAAYHLVTGIS